MPRALERLGVAGAIAVTALASGCGGGGPPARGFGSRQLVEGRDADLRLAGIDAEGTRLYLRRPAATPGVPERSFDLTVVDTASAQQQPLATSVSRFYEGEGPAGRPAPLFIHSFDLVPGTPVLGPDGHVVGTSVGSVADKLTIVEPDTGASTTIADLANDDVCCASTTAPMAMVRTRPEGKRTLPSGQTELLGTLWFGPYDSLRPVTPELFVLGHTDPDADGMLVLAATAAAPEPVGIFHVGADGVSLQEVVPPVLRNGEAVPGPAGLPAAPPAPSPTIVAALFAKLCADAADAGGAGRCFLLYRRAMTVDTGPPDPTLLTLPPTRLFAHFLDEERELELPLSQLPASNLDRVLSPSPDRRALTWEVPGGATTISALATWNLDTGRVKVCHSGYVTSSVAWRADGAAFAALTTVEVAAGGSGARGLILETVGDAPCTRVAAMDVVNFEFSPDGRHLLWLTVPSDGDPTLWLADGDGLGARALVSVADLSTAGFLDDHRVLFRRARSEGYDLSLLDLDEQPIREHPLGEITFGPAVPITSRFMLLAHDYASQDETATLSLVDTLTGDRQLVSRAVSHFLVRTAWQAGATPAAHVPLAYTVKGRNPSDQDGVWVADIPTEPLPP